tara:strand:+ start:177 stop:428 length:252 start_codon:yes stop_codon:yes gene_type:complete
VIEIYSKKVCPFCDKAKALLASKGLEYVEYMVDEDQELFKQMLERSNRRSLPQIFINNHHVGGFDDLYALNQSNGIESLLKGD